VILDDLDQADRYAGLGAGIAAALAFLRRPEIARLEPPAPGPDHSLRVPIMGEEVFALVQRYATKPAQEAFWEAHEQHIDVQCVMEGTEAMGHAPRGRMRVVKAYDAARDLIVLEPDSSDPGVNRVSVSAGMFAIFFPEDAHLPGLTPPDGVVQQVKKIVVKVRVDGSRR
jgi:YhcH/YjgK/YiaL family protein